MVGEMVNIWSKQFMWVWVIACLFIFTGCSTGYGIHRSDGVETLYHKDNNGKKRTVYVLHKNGELKIHDKKDPLIQQFFPGGTNYNGTVGQDVEPLIDETSKNRSLAQKKLIRTGRIKAAKKRGRSDPIYVMVHDTQLGPLLSRSIGSAEETRNQIKQLVAEKMATDQIIRIADIPDWDVEVKLKSYFKVTQALNIKTQKRVSVKAFHFEAHVQSNYLPEDCQTITGLGHWMEYQKVIQETICRVNRFIKEKVGANIPKNRKPFLLPDSQRV